MPRSVLFARLSSAMRKTKQMPVSIGLFVPPGERPVLAKGTLALLHRNFEYAGVSDRHARVSLQVTAGDDKRPINGGSVCFVKTGFQQQVDAFSLRIQVTPNKL
jgi:hypothetical protein